MRFHSLLIVSNLNAESSIKRYIFSFCNINDSGRVFITLYYWYRQFSKGKGKKSIYKTHHYIYLLIYWCKLNEHVKNYYIHSNIHISYVFILHIEYSNSFWYLLDISIIRTTVIIKDIQTIKQSIGQTIALDNYCSKTTDCIVTPIGARACGGPSDYIIYSKLSIYANKIQRLSILSIKLETQYNKDNPSNSLCTIASPPSSSCVKNLCKRASIVSWITYPFGRSWK